MRVISIVGCGLLALCASRVSAETENCTPVAALPTTLSVPGVYCLTTSVSAGITSGIAIAISASDVTLDLNGWTLDGSAAGTATTAWGIYSGARNVAVRNGTVRGFYYGVDLRGAGSRAENLLLDRNTYFGLQVAGQGALVRGNRVVATGGSTASASRAAIGIAVRGPAALVDDNLVSGLTATGTGAEFGIYVLYANDVALRNNVVLDNVRPSVDGSSTGIWLENSSRASLVANGVTNFQSGVAFHNANGTYSRSVVVGCDTPYYGGSAGSGND